jgi:phosphatidate cytidylyltransferase
MAPYYEIKWRIITGIILAVSLIPVYIFGEVWMVSAMFLGILAFILIDEWPKFKQLALTPLYPVLPFMLLIALNHSEVRLLLPIIFLGVFGNDTGAFIAGKLWGKHKLCPSISPGKSWEGVVGGFVFSGLAIGAFLVFNQRPLHWISLVGFTALVCISSTCGDLFESYLKRRAYLKDAGNSLPGHGGWLDRFDGILGAIVVMYPFRNSLALWLGL